MVDLVFVIYEWELVAASICMGPVHKVRVSKVDRVIIFEGQHIRRIVWCKCTHIQVEDLQRWEPCRVQMQFVINMVRREQTSVVAIREHVVQARRDVIHVNVTSKVHMHA